MRRHHGWLSVLLVAIAMGLVLIGLRPAVSLGEGKSPLPPLSFSSIGTTVWDMERSVAFYRDVLQFQKEYDVEFADPGYDRLVGVFGTRVRVAGLSLGPTRIELTQFITPQGRKAPPDFQSNDEWFHHFALIVTDIERATRRLRDRGVRLVSPGPQRFPNGKAYLYFLDPDGHPLEVAEFPGDPPVDPSKLFQRIDHTALVVRNLEESLSFYRRLGFRVEARAESFSAVQQRLNNVFGARLEIATLRRPGNRIAVELLHYVTPSGGRPYLRDSRPNDMIHRHLTLTTRNIEKMFRLLRRAGAEIRSPEVSSFQAGTLGKRRAFYIADPTGHPIEILEK